MRLAAFSTLGIVVVVGLIFLLTSFAVAQPAQSGSYGPCCPLVKGQKAPATSTTAAGTVVTGPRYVCATKPVKLAFGGTTHSVNAMEVTGTLLVPARLFTMMGADLEWGGNRKFVISRGPRRVELSLGSHAVTITNGAEPQMVSWPLCPRLLNGVSYAPLRPLAEALGLAVTFKDGVVNVTGGDAPAAGTAPADGAAGSCPADRVEAGLGVTVVRSPADSAFGVGTGIIEVKPDGVAASLGVQAKDVIIGCDGKPVKCPKDLDQALAQLKASGGSIKTLVVARGNEKVTLQAKPAANQ
jgi:hypothetical protein